MGMQSDGDMTELSESTHTIESANNTFWIYNEDCVAGITNRVQPGSVDVVVTSPPYNVGTSYSGYDDTISRGDYVKWMGKWGKVISEALSDRGSLFLNIGGKPSDPWGPFEVLMELRQHFALQNVFHWIKSIAIRKEDVGRYPGITENVSVGHYKPINSDRYVHSCHEYIFHLTKTGDVELERLAIGVEYQDKSNIARWNDTKQDLRCRGNTWFVPYKTIRNRNKQRPHPATFPIKIPKMCIQVHGAKRADLVLDPFLGIGNSALACVELGLNFIGFETDPDYARQANAAIAQAQSVTTTG